MVTTLPKPKETAAPRPEVLPSEILERDGWCQGRFATLEGQRCLLGAWASSLDLLDRLAAGARLPAVLLSTLVTVGRDTIDGTMEDDADLAAWNDQEGRHMSEVVAVSIEAERRLGWRE